MEVTCAVHPSSRSPRAGLSQVTIQLDGLDLSHEDTHHSAAYGCTTDNAMRSASHSDSSVPNGSTESFASAVKPARMKEFGYYASQAEARGERRELLFVVGSRGGRIEI